MNTIDEILYLPVQDLHPHPDNPRKDLGDLTELAASIKARGVMQNLTVVPAEDGYGYTIIIGHRRAAAANLAGLYRLPCIVADLTPREQMEIMLTENMQRADLTPVEQAQSMRQLVIDFGATPEDIAEKTGFSVRTVKHRLEIAKLDADKLKAAEAKQITIAALEELEQITDIAARGKVLEKYGTSGYFHALEQAKKTQAEDENLPWVLSRLKEEKIAAFPKKEEGRRWSVYDYSGNRELAQITKEKLNESIDFARKKNAKDGKLYYEIYKTYCDERYIRIFWTKKKEKKEIVKKTAKERAREAMIDDRINSLTKLTEQAYRRRREYISKAAGGVIGRYEVDAMLCGFAALAIRSASDWLRDPDFKILAKLENVDEKTPRGKARDMMLENLDGVNDKQARRTELNALYGCFNDGPTAQYWAKVGVNGFPAHMENWILDALYDFLIGMGYELSDDERKLKDGTHELFIDPDETKEEDEFIDPDELIEEDEDGSEEA